MEASSLNQNIQIVLPAGLFQLTIPRSPNDNPASGDFNITGSMQIIGAGVGQTVITGSTDRVMDIGNGALFSIQGVTIQYGSTPLGPMESGYEPGGGIRISNTTAVTIDSCAILNNQGGAGGGVYNRPLAKVS